MRTYRGQIPAAWLVLIVAHTVSPLWRPERKGTEGAGNSPNGKCSWQD